MYIPRRRRYMHIVLLYSDRRRQHGNHHCEGLVLFLSLSLLGELCCAVVAVYMRVPPEVATLVVVCSILLQVPLDLIDIIVVPTTYYVHKKWGQTSCSTRSEAFLC